MLGTLKTDKELKKQQLVEESKADGNIFDPDHDGQEVDIDQENKKPNEFDEDGEEISDIIDQQNRIMNQELGPQGANADA
mmetsp:Transcript_3702/g.6309  ORF Transcript_3702/g.6309 Transcript_3702/m.6309 type:complete len:80 (+) Transcript_3702:202-441(+)|eukprot:CAMPEP_0168607592 /NCGR_PEP_ID=MMETSP0449_2-20121227/139_1 /TAXON_ID=1082188 /ORGANISM="Strombidium rassoulzadegani, Strain ras09" /LENGTH=79 /DNA_ID=CAMNT_0008647447 /DNA_START=153 /DNA_END=392 /DNA_ORIENTATION=+